MRVPDALSYEEASALPCAALTAWSALTLGTAIRSGHTVLTQGTGGVSIFALQLAKATGASVISTTSGAAKADRLRELGADEVVNYRDGTAMGRSRAHLDRRPGCGPRRRSRRTRDDRGVPPRRSTGWGDRVHRLPERQGSGIDFFALFASGATFRHISVGSREGLRMSPAQSPLPASNR